MQSSVKVWRYQICPALQTFEGFFSMDAESSARWPGSTYIEEHCAESPLTTVHGAAILWKCIISIECWTYVWQLKVRDMCGNWMTAPLHGNWMTVPLPSSSSSRVLRSPKQRNLYALGNGPAFLKCLPMQAACSYLRPHHSPHFGLFISPRLNPFVAQIKNCPLFSLLTCYPVGTDKVKLGIWWGQCRVIEINWFVNLLYGLLNKRND